MFPVWISFSTNNFKKIKCPNGSKYGFNCSSVTLGPAFLKNNLAPTALWSLEYITSSSFPWQNTLFFVFRALLASSGSSYSTTPYLQEIIRKISCENFWMEIEICKMKKKFTHKNNWLIYHEKSNIPWWGQRLQIVSLIHRRSNLEVSNSQKVLSKEAKIKIPLPSHGLLIENGRPSDHWNF